MKADEIIRSPEDARRRHQERQPKTAAEILALPIGPEFGQEVVMWADAEYGPREMRRPVLPEIEVVWTEDDEPMMACDADGIWWMVSKYAGGDYFRRRIYAL